MSQTVTNTDAPVRDVQDAPVRDAPADTTTKPTKLLVPRYCVACVQLAVSYDRKSLFFHYFHRYDGLFF